MTKNLHADGQGNLARLIVGACAAFMAISCSNVALAESAQAQSYAVVASIPGPDGGWDYASVDPIARRLYLARHGVAVLDLDSQQWVETVAPAARVNGVLPVPELHRLIFTDGAQPALTVYDTQTNKVIGSALTNLDTDAVAFDLKTGLAAVMTGEMDGVVALVDVQRAVTTGSVPVGGKLEFTVSDGQGLVYINVQSKNEIAVLDLTQRKIVRRIPLTGCEHPGGLAYDPAGGLLIAACRNVAKIVRANDGADLATLEIGQGADAVIGDPIHRRAFIPCGQSGTLVVIDLSDINHLSVVQTVKTEVGARTGALDAKTGKLYLPTAQRGPAIAPSTRPSLVPGTFKVLVLAPG